jgi:sugar lactone lactonase YvrE
VGPIHDGLPVLDAGAPRRAEGLAAGVSPSEHVCNRSLGLCFDKTGDLYIVDAYFGLLKVRPEGGLATLLATEAEGVRFNFTNDLDLDLDDEGNIYFTDSSIHYQRRSVMPCPRSLPSALRAWLDAHLIPTDHGDGDRLIVNIT